MDQLQAYKYCPKCGTSLNVPQDNLLICSNCKYRWYINPSPCVAVVIVNSEDELLFTKRGREPNKDTWDLPGGFVDLDETFEMAVIREIKEELGMEIDIKEIKYFESKYDSYLYSGVYERTLGNVYIVETDQKPQKADDDISDYKFFKLDEIPMNEIAFESIKQIVKDYQDFIKG